MGRRGKADGFWLTAVVVIGGGYGKMLFAFQDVTTWLGLTSLTVMVSGPGSERTGGVSFL